VIVRWFEAPDFAVGISMTYRRGIGGLTFAANISSPAPKFCLNAAANQLDPIPEKAL
jgi:hypothetical protein